MELATKEGELMEGNEAAEIRWELACLVILGLAALLGLFLIVGILWLKANLRGFAPGAAFG